jgi:alpha-D-ribose 1-methylphosphonate 5-triphosphate synthase subunit PhnH
MSSGELSHGALSRGEQRGSAMHAGVLNGDVLNDGVLNDGVLSRVTGVFAEPLSPAFVDPVHDAQATFRALLQAMSSPGTTVALPVQLPGAQAAGLCPALAALVLTLCDVDTPLHWPALSPAGRAWLRFHVGAPLLGDRADVADHADRANHAVGANGADTAASADSANSATAAALATARFVVALDTLPALALLDSGSDEAPETSATLLLRLPRLDGGTPMQWHGPGIERPLTVALPVPGSFWADWRAQHARFPLGVDVIATDGRHLLALPRTTQVGAPGRAQPTDAERG